MGTIKDIWDIGKDIGEGAGKKLEEGRRKATPLTDPPPRPKRSFLFRDELVETLCRQITAAGKTAYENKFLLSGFGGVGKTAVARALYHELKDKYKQIGWVECRESGDLRASLLASVKYGITAETEQARFEQIKTLLANAGGDTILFLDNVDRDDPMLDKLTGYDVTLVVTSRMAQVEGYTSIFIPQLTEDECVELFRVYCARTLTEEDEPVVRELVKLVSCHTLSVELLAKGIPAGMGLEAYLERLKAEGFGFPGLTFRTGHDEEIGTITDHLKKLFDMAGLDGEQARVMQNLALMADSRTLPFAVRNWVGCEEDTLAALVNTGWLTQTAEGYEVHPIVRQVVLLDEMPLSAVEYYLDYVTHPCSYFWAYDDYRSRMLKLGIVEAVLEQVEDELEENRDTAALYNKVGCVHRNQGQYAQAKERCLKALEIRINVLGEEHPGTATSYNDLGVVYADQGQYAEAEKCHRKALDIRRKVMGEEDPYTAMSYNNLGIACHYQGEYAQAEEYYQEALNIRCKAKGENHPDIAMSYNNLGAVYADQGKYAQAETYYEKALDSFRHAWGEEDPTTANSYNNLGNIYKRQGKYAQAEECYQKALCIRRKMLEEERLTTAVRYNNVGTFYEAQGNYDEAVEQYLYAWRIYQKAFGPEHPGTETVKNSLRRVFPHIAHGDEDFETWLSRQQED